MKLKYKLETINKKSNNYILNFSDKYSIIIQDYDYLDEIPKDLGIYESGDNLFIGKFVILSENDKK